MALDKSRLEEIEVCGEGVYTIVRGIEADSLCKILLDKYGLQDPQKGAFYSVKNFQALLHEIDKRMPSVLKNIGEYICIEVEFPPTANLEQILMSTDIVYLNSHRNYQEDEIGHYLCEKIGDRDFLMTADDLYPCSFDQGIINGYAKKFNEQMVLEHQGKSCRSRGDPQCIYRIRY